MFDLKSVVLFPAGASATCVRRPKTALQDSSSEEISESSAASGIEQAKRLNNLMADVLLALKPPKHFVDDWGFAYAGGNRCLPQPR